MTQYIFDIFFTSTIRVSAETEADARQMIEDNIDTGLANFGAWPAGDPIIAEVFIEEEGVCRVD